jgi:ParB family chromosome partitioning protein
VANTKKKGLGKGLGALISSSGATPERAGEPSADGDRGPSANGLIDLNPRDIRPNPHQPRVHFDEDALEELAESIKQDGVHQPIVVRHRGDVYEIVSGERRVRASILAELATVPAVVRDVSDEDMLKLGLIENIQREDLNPIETAKAYKALAAHFDWTQDELAAQVGKKRATVTNTMRLLNLPMEVQDLVESGQLNMGHARALLSAETASRQSALARRAVQEGLSVREVERLASGTRATSSEAKAPARKDPHVSEIEDELRRRFGTKVRLSTNAAWKGKIEIDFFDLNELERVLRILRGR